MLSPNHWTAREFPVFFWVLILYQVLCKTPGLIRQPLPLGVALGSWEYCRCVGMKYFIFLDIGSTSVLLFVHLWILVLSPCIVRFQTLMKKYVMSYNFIFYFTQHLMHCRQYSITVLRLLQRRLCHGPSASKGSSYHTHTNIHELSNPWKVCIVICSELWQSMACNPNCTHPPAPLHKTD